MTLEMQVKKLLGINAVQNIMAKFQYYYTVSDYDAITSGDVKGDLLNSTSNVPSLASKEAPKELVIRDTKAPGELGNEGKQLEVTVDGKAAELTAGTITGKIHIAVV